LHNKNTTGNKKEENPLKKIPVQLALSPSGREERKISSKQTKKSSCKKDILTENC